MIGSLCGARADPPPPLARDVRPRDSSEISIWIGTGVCTMNKSFRIATGLAALGLISACQPADEEPGGPRPLPAASTLPGKPAHPSMLIAETDSMPAPVVAYCGMCHAVPHPGVLTTASWPKQLEDMWVLLEVKRGVVVSDQHRQETDDYYMQQAPKAFEVLPDDSVKTDHFRRISIARPLEKIDPGDRKSWPQVANVNFVDLDQDGRLDVLVADMQYQLVAWLHHENGRGMETPLAGWGNVEGFKAPCHTEAFDYDGDGDLDIVVAILGQLPPTDWMLGHVVLLINDGQQKFEPIILLKETARVADVRPADLDGDGDWDFAVAMFGMSETGQVAWLEQVRPGEFQLNPLLERNGCSHIPVGDLNDDGRPDIVAAVTQEFEKLVAFVNVGGGTFEHKVLFEALNPGFGTSGIELVDLDGDEDLDILFTNGDGFENAQAKPYHGVQWLENVGEFQFEYHELTRFYGAYSANAGDLDLDGDMDIVVASCFMSSSHEDWEDLPRQGMIWLENDGGMQFTRHAITDYPTHVVSTDLADMTGDGKPDIIAGGMNVFPPFPPPHLMSRVALWVNVIPAE